MLSKISWDSLPDLPRFIVQNLIQREKTRKQEIEKRGQSSGIQEKDKGEKVHLY